MVKVIFILACAIAFAAPFVLTKEISPKAETVAPFRGFPAQFEGIALRELPLTGREHFFLEDFPGEIGRFTDGRREIVIRRVTEATRKLHPAADCFKAIGYETKPLPMKSNESGKRWSCFSAVKTDEHLRVCERISDDAGNEWTDVSAWYWAALGETNGEWWAFTVAERE